MAMYINSFVGCLPVSSGVGFWPHPILTSDGGGAKKPGYYLGELLQQHQQQQHSLGILTPHPFSGPSLGAGYLCTQSLSPTPASNAGLAPLQALCSAPGVSAFMTRSSASSDRSSSSISDRPSNPPPLKFGISRILSEDFGKSKSEKENRYKLLGLSAYPEDSRSHPGCPCNSPACPAFGHHPHHPHHPPFPSPVLSAVTALQPPQYPIGNGADALPGPYSILNADGAAASQPKRKRSWSRAVFSNLQRKGLERRFEVQKYVTKPDRRQLASMLGSRTPRSRSGSKTDA